MKKSEYPETVDKADYYTAGDVAILLSVAHRTACKIMDTEMSIDRKATGRKERLVAHENLLDYLFLLDDCDVAVTAITRIVGLTEEEIKLLTA